MKREEQSQMTVTTEKMKELVCSHMYIVIYKYDV